jgi:hypothetical protein
MILTDIFRHPVKSLGSESLKTIQLSADEAMPGDRRYAITHAKSQFDHGSPAWERCRNFLRIANVPELAAYEVAFDPVRQMLWLTDAQGHHAFDLSNDSGRRDLAALVAAAPQAAAARPLTVVDVPGVSLSDSPFQAISLGSRATLRALEAAGGFPLDPRRFRLNLWIDGNAPWTEFDLVGRTFQIGTVRFEGIEPITRCLVPAANPVSGKRDTNPLQALSTHFGHKTFGILARVLHGGKIDVGADLTCS